MDIPSEFELFMCQKKIDYYNNQFELVNEKEKINLVSIIVTQFEEKYKNINFIVRDNKIYIAESKK